MDRSLEGSRELQCVGKLEIAIPKPVGFLCGSIPVPTDKAFHSFASALIPSSQTVSAPRYRMLPTETDLNRPPLLPNFPEKALRIDAVQSKATGGLPWDDGSVPSDLTRKCEALAVSGLVEYGDEIDVIAPTDILKQIFKIPYSKGRLSIAVQRIGQTLVLNSGPDIEEGEKLIRRHNNQTKCADQSLFLNFAMQSVRKEACDCPTNHAPSQAHSNSSVLPGVDASHFVRQDDDFAQHEGLNRCSDYAHIKQDGLFWGKKRNKGRHPVQKVAQVGEKPKCSVQESEKHRRVGNDEFLRVLFWQFHNFRMLLGSDLLLFSNEKYVAVSLHLWDVARQITPSTWLEAWLDNIMASVPELAICYHRNGVVQGYELLKTDDIFLLKGISEDGTPAFHPYVVQQNGLSVLRFLQENCKQEPGAYWLYKSAGEDMIQLFDLSVISKNHSSSDCDDSSTSLPSLLHRGRSDSMYSLGTLLYRIAHRLSLSMAPGNQAKCAKFIKKCLDFLEEPDHLVVRAFAHEQFARLILNYEEDLGLTSEALRVKHEFTVTDVEEESQDFPSTISESAVQKRVSSVIEDEKPCEDGAYFQDLVRDASIKMTLEANASDPMKTIESGDLEYRGSRGVVPSCDDENDCELSPTTTHVQTVVDPISSKLAAIHHVSQAIKSLRWMRQLQSTESEMEEDTSDVPPPSIDLSICACGDADCIEVCDIREWLPTSKLDHKLWKLVLLLGESYLALGHAYKEDGQLHKALKIVELASSVYGSMPQHLEETRFISSMISWSSVQTSFGNDKTKPYNVNEKDLSSSSNEQSLSSKQFSSTYLFWAKAWTLVGDVYVEFYILKDKEFSIQAERRSSSRELKVSSEVVKEVKRLKKRLGQYMQNCSSCSLVNCSCQGDRASSGNSASSSGADTRPLTYGRKHHKRSHTKSSSSSLLGDLEDEFARQIDNRQSSDGGFLHHNIGGITLEAASEAGKVAGKTLSASNFERVVDTSQAHGAWLAMASPSSIASSETLKVKNGGIFEFLGGPIVGDAEYNLSIAQSCYEEARNALGELASGSGELQSLTKKQGWVCNELGRYWLARKEIKNAELAFADAIKAFREVSDHTNIILINCNLGHGRRALAEEMLSKIDEFKVHAVFHDSYNHALETAKLEYSESLGYYVAAKLELNYIPEEAGSVPNSLRTEVYTQFAHTYLRLGMLLAREDTTAEVYANRVMEDAHMGKSSSSIQRSKKQAQKHEVSANDAIREALSMYESLGELRKQESAYAYFQLACYQRDCSLKFLKSDGNKGTLPKGENGSLQRVKQYALLAERNWQKAADFYGPKTHPTMYLTILIERSALSSSLSGPFHSNGMLEAALSRMLEGRHLSEANPDLVRINYPELHSKFWSQLQMLLKKMLSVALLATGSNCPASKSTPASNRFLDAGKLRELYKRSLVPDDFSQLHAMYSLWTS